MRGCGLTSDPKIKTAPTVTNQQQISPEILSANATDAGPVEAPKGIRSGRGSIWLTRIRALLFVTLCATFGVLLLILPWTPRWTDNPLLLSFPELRDFVSSGFVRGLSSGLGLIDLWLGFWEAIHYHESPI
jgi:hypothetical protein